MELKNYLKKAKKENWAIGQFNFSTLEQLRGILAGAKRLKSPVILGTSEGESRFLGLEEILALVEISKMKCQVPAFLHFDHGKDLNWIKKAVDFGYSSVHFDGSNLSFQKNIKKTKKVVDYARKKGVFVEGELGYIGGASKIHKKKIKIRKSDLTSPDMVSEFIKKTGVDSLAVSIGNIHGIVQSGNPSPTQVSRSEIWGGKLDFERLKEISKVAKVFLVLHGASGIPNSDIKKAIALDIVKININTELRAVWAQSIKKIGNEVIPYNVLPKIQNSIQKKVEEKIKLFNSVNKV
jgi:ketose-bisphosphate aldolase